MTNSSTVEKSETSWKALYRVGGIAILIAVIFFRRNLGTELTTFKGFGIFTVPETAPTSALDWFTLLQNDKFIGLALFDVADLINYALVGLFFLALYGALRQTNKGAMVAATAFGLIGVGVYLASNQAFSMLVLSEHYAAATTDAQRSTFLAAGEALLAIHNPSTIYHGTGIYASLFLVPLAGLIISIVMLRSDVFSKATAIVGILANGIVLGYFIALVFAPALIWIPPTVSAPFRVIWYIMIAIKLFKLGKDGK